MYTFTDKLVMWAFVVVLIVWFYPEFMS